MPFLGLGGDKVTTQTETLGDVDAAHIARMRRAGIDAANAQGQVGHVGANPYTLEAMQRYQNMGGDFAQYQQMGMLGLLRSMQPGAAGLGAYRDPYLQEYFASQDPLWAHEMGMAGTAGKQFATGQGAYGGDRAGLAVGQMMGDVSRAKMAQYGQAGLHATDRAYQALFGEKARLGQMGYNLANLGTSGMFQMNNALMQGGDYLRNIDVAGENQEAYNAARAADLIRSSYGEATERTSEHRESGSWLGDLFGVGSTIAGAVIGGPAGAMAGNQLGAMMSPSNYGTPTLAPWVGGNSGLNTFGGAPGADGSLGAWQNYTNPAYTGGAFMNYGGAPGGNASLGAWNQWLDNGGGLLR